MLSLVAKVFKGEGFKAEGTSEYVHLLVRAKCPDLDPAAQQSQPVRLSSSRKEIKLDHQFSWAISQQQLKGLRTRQSSIKVNCILLYAGLEKSVGYVVLKIRDAVDMTFGNINARKPPPVTYPLLGTRGIWTSHMPKIQIRFQLEHFKENIDPIPRERAPPQENVMQGGPEPLNEDQIVPSVTPLVKLPKNNVIPAATCASVRPEISEIGNRNETNQIIESRRLTSSAYMIIFQPDFQVTPLGRMN